MELKLAVRLSDITLFPPGEFGRYLNIPFVEAKVSGLDLVGRSEPVPL